MATVNLGAIRFNWKGAYNNGTAYVVDDVVSSAGNSYICILASTGNAVSNATYWSIMSSAGTNGTDGTDVGTTITTQGDVLFRDGSGLQRLAKGTASQSLTMNAGATAPEWTTPAGGDTKRLGGATFNGVSTVVINPTDFDMKYNVATGYDGYKLYVAVFNTTDSQYNRMWTSSNSGSSWHSSGYNYHYHGRYSGSDKHGNEANAGEIDIIKPMQSNNNPLSRLHYELTMYKDTYEDSYFHATIIWAGGPGTSTGHTWGGTGTICSSNTDVDALKLGATSGNIDGNWTMYGFKS